MRRSHDLDMWDGGDDLRERSAPCILGEMEICLWRASGFPPELMFTYTGIPNGTELTVSGRAARCRLTPSKQEFIKS